MSSKKSLYPDKPMYTIELDKKALVYMSILTFGALFLLGSMFRHYPMGGMQMNKYLDEMSVQLEFIYDTLRQVNGEFSDLNKNVFELNKNLEKIGNNLERIANQMQQVILMMGSMLCDIAMVSMTSSFLDKVDVFGVDDDAREVIKPLVQAQIKHNPNILRVLELLNNELNDNDQVGHSYVQLFIARIRSEYETKEFEGDD